MIASPLSLRPHFNKVQHQHDYSHLICSGHIFRSKHNTVVRLDRRKMDLVRRIVGGCFAAPPERELKVELHSGGGEDVFDSEVMESKNKADHLVVMVSGLIGSAADWNYAAKQFVKKHPDKVIVHRSMCNSATLTFDGVDRTGERLAEEVLSVVRHRPEVQKISFVAHSLGGLIARYAAGRLYEHPQGSATSGISEDDMKKSTNYPTNSLETNEGRIAGLEPMNFITFATPHLGSRWHRQLPFLCGFPFLEKKASQSAHLIVGRTGKHLFLTDNGDGKPPLLVRMVNDHDDLKFISALRAFKRRVAYSNISNDYVVGWRTSSIRREEELPKFDLHATDAKYPHVVHVEGVNTDSINMKSSPIIVAETADLEEEMIRGLNQVSWERVDVSFHRSTQRFTAHNTIQVKTYWLNSDGADVIFHMIDTLLL